MRNPRLLAPDTSVIVAGARTPIGRLMGSLSGHSATDLGGIAIRSALSRAGIRQDQVDYVIMGHVIQAGTGQITARQAAVNGGIPMSVPALTINKVCLSGLNAIALADQLIRTGEHEIVVAGGMESMSQAPHFLKGLRAGQKYGDTALIDSMAYDALHDQFTQQAMGLLADERNRLSDGLTRHEQDVFAALSHKRASAAASQGFFADEIVPVTTEDRAGQRIISADEGVRPGTTVDSLTALRPAFSPNGTITAGTSSQISDGAAAVVVMSKTKAQSLGLPWLAEIGASGQVAGPDSSLQSQPANAIKSAAKKQGIAISDIDLFEINEAFAAVAIQSARELGVGVDRVNVNGGALALGHPVGMSGTRIALALANELRRRGGGIGAAALCGGGGQGDALILTASPTS